jgi:hypothetical protein
MEDSLGRTFGIKKELQGDIIHFLAARYTRGAVLSLGEVMRLYRCAEPRARRVLEALEEDRMLVPLGGDSYRVSV